jgi:hypothetical protein
MKMRHVLLVGSFAFLAAPVQADELDDLYRSYKNSGDEVPQWVIDGLFGPDQDDGSRCAGGDTYDDAYEIPFVPCGTFTDTGNTHNFARNYDFTTPPGGCYNVADFAGPCFDGRDAVYTFTLPGTFTVSASTCNHASYDSVLGIVDEEGNLVAMNDDHEGCAGYSSLIEACCLEAGTYYVVVDGYGRNAKGSFTLSVAFGCAPCGEVDDDGCDDLVATDVELPYHGTLNTNGAPDVFGTSSGEVAIRFSLDGATAVNLESCFPGTNFDVDSYWFAGAAPCDGGEFLGYNDGEQDCNWATHVFFDCDTPLPAGTYVVLLSGWECQEGVVELELTGESCQPVEAGDQPGGIHLRQNAPNPFNPATMISFTLAETGPARLSVHDLAGREVALLVNGLLAAGEHSLSFDAGRLSSGVYFYTLEAGNRVETRKMILTR